ncbi:MAG: MarR family transcriptional regulator [Caulobacter vibrioides]|uniref:MarR family transcriptional regulator n=1 Tax=Caulobacter vibrioides TaxID=155892 RepID=A0A258CQB4_CAUVI|nr:MAG: MarR family transcriptional regulator [Caulobacter vibrioides]
MTARHAFGQAANLMSRRWRARLDERLKDTGLSQARWLALFELSSSDGGLTQRDLADRLGIEAPNDRRAKRVTLTAAAEPVLDHITSIAATLRDELLADISDADLVTCLSVLGRVNQRLAQR